MDCQAGLGLGDTPECVGGGAGAVPAVLAEVDGDDRLDRLAVLGHERSGHLAVHHAGHAGEAGRVGGRLRLVRGGYAPGPVIDHHGRVHVG